MKEKKKDKNEEYFREIIRKLDSMGSMLKKILGENVVTLGDDDEKLLDNQDLCMLLGISKRTLQRYRQNGVLTYYIVKGKPYYKASEVKDKLRKICKS